jgi:ribonuclease T2
VRPARYGFIVHGLWPQNYDGSYPVSCAEAPGPAKPEANLDITPDLALLQHEWEKHGTCTTMSPEDFFAAEHRAFHLLVIPEILQHTDHELQTTRIAWEGF